MQGNARGTYESGGKAPGERRGMQGNAGEYRGIPGERMGVGAKCQGNAGNAGECQGKLWEWVQTARGMQENARGTDGSVKCQGNAGE